MGGPRFHVAAPLFPSLSERNLNTNPLGVPPDSLYNNSGPPRRLERRSARTL